MLSRVVKVQVIVFVVLSLLGVGFVGAKYVGLDQYFGASGYVVKLRLAESGGIFDQAEVTYRGVPIGRVGELRLIDDGVEADLRIESGAPRVPRDVEAVVTNRSAAGEQYVDLRPRSGGGPYLKAGSVIEPDDTSVPIPVETVLLNLDQLVESVPKADLKVVVDELYLATQGNATSMQVLLDSAASITKEATEHLPQTTKLIGDAGTVLQTQLDMSDSLRSFGANAKLVAGQLKRSDGDIRKVLADAPGAAGQVAAAFEETGSQLGVLIANLLSTSTVLHNQYDGLDKLLTTNPKVVSAASNVITSDGANFGLATTFFDPLPCTSGYEGTKYRKGSATSDLPLNTSARCNN